MSVRRALAATGLSATTSLALACFPSFAGFEGGAGDAALLVDGGDRAPSGARWQRVIRVQTGDALLAGFALRVTDFGDLGHLAAELSNAHVYAPEREIPRLVDRPPMPKLALWFKLPNAIAGNAVDTSYRLVYGDSVAPLEGAVFLTDATFSGGALPDGWAAEGTVSFAAAMAIVGPNADGGSSSVETKAPDVAAGGVGVDMLAVVPAADSSGTFWLGFQGGDFSSCPWQLWRAVTGKDVAPSYCDSNASVDSGIPSVGAGMFLFGIERTFVHTRYVMNGDLKLQVAWTDTTPLAVVARTNMATGTISVLRVRTRDVVESEPQITVGAEEPAL